MIYIHDFMNVFRFGNQLMGSTAFNNTILKIQSPIELNMLRGHLVVVGLSRWVHGAVVRLLIVVITGRVFLADIPMPRWLILVQDCSERIVTCGKYKSALRKTLIPIIRVSQSRKFKANEALFIK